MTNKLKHNIDKTALEVARALEDASTAYFTIGIDLYLDRKKSTWKSFQPVIGNLSIACELLLKVFVARKIFSCLYPNLKKDRQAILNYSESMPSSTAINWFIGDLRDFTENTIDIKQAISYFYQLYPEQKQEFKPHLDLLSVVRNISVHAAIPDVQKYHMERIAYITCKLFMHAEAEKYQRVSGFNVETLNAIIEGYDKFRVKKVHSAIEDAKRKLKSLKGSQKENHLYDDDWNYLNEICPVCKSESYCYGYTEEDETHKKFFLGFWKESFECDFCELSLEDEEELSLAGIQTYEDISLYEDDWHEYKSSESNV